MQFARLNGVTLHYQTVGMMPDSPAKPILVFSNSLGTDFRIWRDCVMRLAGDFAILLYDKRGHGLSDIGETPYSIDDHVGDLAGLMDHVGVKDAIICGLSVGGLIAQGLYAGRPDLVRALVLCDTANKIGDDALWNGRIEAIEKSGLAGLADGILERWFTTDFRTPDNAAFACYSNMLRRTPAEGYGATCVAIRDADFTEEAAKIAVPTLCVVGDQDGATPPDVVEATAKLIADAGFEVIKDAGHLPCIEQPEELVVAIRKFLKDRKIV